MSETVYNSAGGSDERTIIASRHLNLYYGDNHALKDISFEIPANRITALIGPSGCGKSTFLKTLNRMRSLRDAAIWDEVKDRLNKSALGLSGGQQQRLCIARALAVEPDILLMDESTSALDPISTSKIEDLAMELKNRYTVIMVTHNMQQAVRVSDKTAFFLLGELVEYGDTERIFSHPQEKRTEDYITGRFG